MIKVKMTVLTFLITALFSGCGGSGSTFSGDISDGNTKYHCTSESAYNACKAGDCSECTLVSGTPEEENYPDCNVTGNTVHVPKNGRCQANDHKLVCDDNGLTMDSGITSGIGTIQINDTIYQCAQ